MQALGYRTESEGMTQRIIRMADNVIVYERTGWPIDLQEMIEKIVEWNQNRREGEIRFWRERRVE